MLVDVFLMSDKAQICTTQPAVNGRVCNGDPMPDLSTLHCVTRPDHDMQAVVNEDALGTNVMLKAELHRVKVQLAAMHGQPPAMDTALATSLAFDAQPNTAAAQAAQVRNRLPAAPASAA